MHVAFGSESLLKSHPSESTTKGSPEKREVGDTDLTVMGVCGKVYDEELSSRKIQVFLERGREFP
jgi:hypothetical protein